MTAVVLRAALTEDPIELAEHEALVAHEAAGAVVSFAAHPSAQRTLADIAAEVSGDANGVRAIAVSHRVGTLRIGDAALVAAVAADHRQAAFDTCARLVDTVKARLPVWKHQYFADGSDEWVGSP